MWLGAGFLVLVRAVCAGGVALFALVRPVGAVRWRRCSRWSRWFALVRPDGAGAAGSRWRGGARWGV